MFKPSLWLLPLTVGFVACGSDGGSHQKPPPAGLEIAGDYALATKIEVPPTVLASQAAVDFIELLRLLRDDPATAFFQLLDQAGVPLVADLFAILPDVLKGELGDAINDYWRSRVGAGGGNSEIDQILAFADGTLARFTLASRLDIPALPDVSSRVDGGVHVRGHHAVDAVVFDAAAGLPVPVPRSLIESLPILPGPLDADPMLTLASATAGHGDAALTVGDHFFGLAYGELIFAALNGAGTGETLRAHLGRAFDCPAMGQAVANRCVLLLCIGHASEVTQICERGLDLAVDKLHARLSGLSFRALRFEAGTADLWDARVTGGPIDGRVDRIDRGDFTKASIDVGTGPRACRATFSGERSP
jgi:hypothetical protein